MALLYVNSSIPGWAAQVEVERLTMAGLGQSASEDTQDSGWALWMQALQVGARWDKGPQATLVCDKAWLQMGEQGIPLTSTQNPRRTLGMQLKYGTLRSAFETQGHNPVYKGQCPSAVAEPWPHSQWPCGPQASPGYRTQRTREEDEFPLGSPRVKARLGSLEVSAINGGIMRPPPPPRVNQAPGNTNKCISISNHVCFCADDPLDAFTTVSKSLHTLPTPLKHNYSNNLSPQKHTCLPGWALS